ncbi:hypothetical protein CYMTET_51458 [Cymbomonas tetramitiformis]|uniref:Golgi SNAP receptor complex member 1 n=1 Tax=Cymbomonas tetramitiformis TaxID=36881 RepID=A0AAE0BL09_9CHLO|nr:hypothetical protein CYMTET_51458 [Cymbomonas tetramitiformis]
MPLETLRGLVVSSASKSQDQTQAKPKPNAKRLSCGSGTMSGVRNVSGSPSGDRVWEELRKEARKLEGEVDIMLASFSKLGTGDSSSSLLGDTEDQMVSGKAQEIESHLQRLADVNDAMSSAVSGGGDARSHTLARHRDILSEFSQEFRRIRTTITIGRERDALLGGRVVSDGNGGSGFLGAQGNGSSNGAGALLRERNSIQSANARLDDVIGQAQATMSNLTSQRSIFEDMGTRLNQVGTKFPVIGGILNAIKRKKSQDTIILSAVIASCTLFLIVYWLAK